MPMIRKQDDLTMDFRKNSLDTVRLLAALSVMYFHGREHLAVGGIPLLDQVLNYFTGIPLFFALSGYLLWNSSGGQSDFLSYGKKRFRRIYPELWLGVAVELIVLVLLFREPIQWGMLALFAIGQSTVFQFWTPDFLRSYGCGTPNGSLWSICTLIQFYILVYPARRLLHGKKPWVWLTVLAVSIFLGATAFLLEPLLPVIVYKLYQQTILPYLWLFVAGMLVGEFRDRIIPFLRRWWYVFAVLSVAVHGLKWDLYCGFYPLLRSYTLILAALGTAYRFPALKVPRDISYGIYIYHMTVINAVIALALPVDNGGLVLVMAISCLPAWGSSRLFQPAKPAKQQNNI